MRATLVIVIVAIGVAAGIGMSGVISKAAQPAPAGMESAEAFYQSLVGKQVYIELQSYHSLNVGEGRVSGISGILVAVGRGMVTVRTDGGFSPDHPVASVPTSAISTMWSGKKSDATTRP